MEQSSTDRRVRKTKKQLRLALMELLAEKSAKSISVRELTERADINRGTFYIHYRDVGDLLQRLEDEMADRLTALCKDHKPEGSSSPSCGTCTALSWTTPTCAGCCWVPMETSPTPTASAAFCGIIFCMTSCPSSIPGTGSG